MRLQMVPRSYDISQWKKDEENRQRLMKNI